MAQDENPAGFDYSTIPSGYYHDAVTSGHPIRRAWHRQKFTRVVECLSTAPNQSIVDIGCFAGSFLSLLPEQTFTRQLGIDILPNQIEYAQRNFGTSHRSFIHVKSITEITLEAQSFDNVTIIEVIEHLRPEEIRELLNRSVRGLKSGGRLILTTPNYTSTWPLLEIILNRLSEVSYEEQHITRFNYFNVAKKLQSIAPDAMNSLRFDFITTTHFVAPFLASFGDKVSDNISNAVNHTSWRFPFGNLILMSLTKI
jgi:SAM-dependent methyltransferase